MILSRDSLRYWLVALLLFLLHAVLMFSRYGQLPAAPSVLDEVIVNDGSVPEVTSATHTKELLR